jgi:branched-chain amino acid transport system substrate-binding protein
VTTARAFGKPIALPESLGQPHVGRLETGDAMERDRFDLSSGTESRSGVSRRTAIRIGAGTAVGLFAPAIVRGAEPGVIRIGQIEALTGPSAPYGQRANNGAALVADDFNKAGVVIGGTTYKIEIASGDMGNDARQAITLLRQYASDERLVCQIGPSNSVGYVPLVPVAGQLKIPSIGTGSGAPVKEWNPYAYRVNPVSTVAVPAVLAKVVPLEKIKRLAVIFDQTQDAQRGDAEVCKAMAAKLGYDVVAYEAFRAGDQDFSPQIATVRASRPDAVYVAGATGDGVKVASQIREAGITKPMMTGFGSFQDPVYWDGTKGQVKGDYTWLAQDLQAPSPVLKDFLERYRAKFQQEATSFSSYGADALTCVVEALKKAGAVDRAKLQEALASLEITTPIGSRVRFQNPPEGNNLGAQVVVIKVNGRGTYDTV